MKTKTQMKITVQNYSTSERSLHISCIALICFVSLWLNYTFQS